MSLKPILDAWRQTPVRTRGLWLIAALSALLVAMALNAHIRRQSGDELILVARPVDPRDLIRGAYVALDYDIESTPADTVEELASFANDKVMAAETPVWLSLRQKDGAWKVVRVLKERPGPHPGERVMRARWLNRDSLMRENMKGAFLFDIGVDRYFADQKRARELEQALREPGGLQIILAIARDGKPAIKGLVVQGQRREETFF